MADQTMYDMFSGMLKDHLGRSEFVDAMKKVVAEVQKLKLSNAQEIALMHQRIQILSDKLKNDTGSDLKATKQAAMEFAKSSMQTIAAQHAQKLSEIDAKLALIQDGEDGEDGKTPTEEELTAIITRLIPKTEPVKDVDIEAIVAKVMEKIPRPTIGSRVGWGAHPLAIQGSGVTKVKVARQINFTGATVTHSADGVTTVAVSGGAGNGYQAISSGAVNGSNTVFVWATAPKAIVVDGGRTMQKTSSDGTTNWTGTTTTTLTVAPTFDIYAVA